MKYWIWILLLSLLLFGGCDAVQDCREECRSESVKDCFMFVCHTTDAVDEVCEERCG